jgi:hypothetical protein
MLVTTHKNTLEKTKLSFKEGILTVRFVENSLIDVDDIIYMYCYGIERSKGKPYAVLLDSSSTHELTEEAVIYLANSSHINNIVAIAYISKTKISKIRLSLFMIFERPPIKPEIFNDELKALDWLKMQVNSFALKIKLN